MAHTPAPWTVNAKPLEEATAVEVVCAKGSVICEVMNTSLEDDANARLLAAAPELLAALQALIQNAGKTMHKPAGQKAVEAYVVSAELIAVAEAAIAKAGGAA